MPLVVAGPRPYNLGFQICLQKWHLSLGHPMSQKLPLSSAHPMSSTIVTIDAPKINETFKCKFKTLDYKDEKWSLPIAVAR